MGGLGSIHADGVFIASHIPLVEVQSIEYICDVVGENPTANENTRKRI
jgi:hypothetical protein